jgi:hypothetical protein
MKSWRTREKLYTKRYARLFERLLNRIWRRAAIQYGKDETFTVKDEDFIPLYRRLYTQIGTEEAKIAFAKMPREKDIMDAMATFFQGSANSPETITFIRSLMGDYFNVYVMQRLREVSENTRKQIRDIIQKGFDEGLGARERARLIREAAPEINSTRSIRIARTESVTAANKAALLSHEASPYVYEKAWLAVDQPGRTRPSHLAMDPSRFIPLWDYFFVANANGALDSMLAPGDTAGDVSNVVNCRCTLLFKAKRGEDGRLVRKNSLQTV